MNLADALGAFARADPGRLAIRDGGISRTRGAMASRVARLAAAFGAMAPAGARVALLMASSHRMIELYFAPLMAGQIMTALNTRWTLEEIAEAVSLTQPAILCADRAFIEVAEKLRRVAPDLRLVFADDGAAPDGWLAYEALATDGPAMTGSVGGDDDPACLFFTSGTSGTLKAATLTHRNLAVNAAEAIRNFRLDAACVQLHAQPLFHLAGGARVFNVALSGGVHVVAERFAPAEALALIARERVTHFGVVPTMLAMLLDHPDSLTRDLSSMRVIGYGAAPMPETLLRRALERWPQLGFVQSYGMTELSPVATCLTIADHAEAARGGVSRLRSVGRAVPHVEIEIRDTAGRALPAGEIGEVCVRGPTVMAGYWNDPAATAAAVRDGWMHTGDAGYFDADGYLHLVDRIKDIVITGGENVASIEVEDALYRHPAVAECAVVGLPHPHWGEVVHAVVVTRGPVETAALEAHCRAHLAGFKIPRSWDIRSAPLPRNAVGKILKHVLRRDAGPRAA